MKMEIEIEQRTVIRLYDEISIQARGKIRD
jgi:hypothetical protein